MGAIFPGELADKEKIERKRILAALKQDGLTIRQTSRLTKINRGLYCVQRLILCQIIRPLDTLTHSIVMDFCENRGERRSEREQVFHSYY
jgi:hypothetical protein